MSFQVVEKLFKAGGADMDFLSVSLVPLFNQFAVRIGCGAVVGVQPAAHNGQKGIGIVLRFQGSHQLGQASFRQGNILHIDAAGFVRHLQARNAWI